MKGPKFVTGVGVVAHGGWRALAGFAWGAGFTDGQVSTRILFGVVGVCFVVDHVMRLWLLNSEKKNEHEAEAIAATLNGSPLDPDEAAELRGVLLRAVERRKRPAGAAN